jgi:hypothetical protein
MVWNFLLALISFLPPNTGDTSITVWKSSNCYNNFKIVLNKAGKGSNSYFGGTRVLENGKVLYFKAKISKIHKNDSLITFSINQYVFSYEESFTNKIAVKNELILIERNLPISFIGYYTAKGVIKTCIIPKLGLNICYDCKFYLVAPVPVVRSVRLTAVGTIT